MMMILVMMVVVSRLHGSAWSKMVKNGERI
jgi:hypothetical protein